VLGGLLKGALPPVAPNKLLDELRSIPGVAISTRHGVSRIAITADLYEVVRDLCAEYGAEVNFDIRNNSIDAAVANESEIIARIPSSAREKFYPWQTRGVVLLVADQKRGLHYAAGTGKTSTALAAAYVLNTQRIVIVTRSLGRDVFLRDSTWAAPGKSIAIVVGEGSGSKLSLEAVRRADKRLDALRERGSEGFACSTVEEAVERGAWAIVVPWETLPTHSESLAALGVLELLILDEHHLGKNSTSQRGRAALTLSGSAQRTWSMTATPVRDHLIDFWAQWRSVAPRASGASKWKFAIRYSHAVSGRYGGLDVSGPHKSSECDRCARTSSELMTRVGFYFETVTREAIRNRLPAKTRAVIRIAASRSRKIIARRENTELSIRGVERLLAQAAEIKFDDVVERASEALIAREKVILIGNRLVWVGRALAAVREAVSKHRPTRESLWSDLATGEVEVSKRQAIARVFLSAPAPACLVATIDSVSEAIDLQDADRMIVASLPFTPGQVIQLEGRVARPGQKRPVCIEYFVAESTFDEHIEATLLGKLAAIEETGTATETDSLSSLADGWTRSENEIVAELSKWLEEKAA